MVAYSPLFIAFAGLILIFIPIELYAAIATPTKTDTFSEFVWWSFGVRPRKSGKRVRFALCRRFLLGAFLWMLYLHLVFAFSWIGFIVLSPFVAANIVYSFVYERN